VNAEVAATAVQALNAAVWHVAPRAVAVAISSIALPGAAVDGCVTMTMVMMAALVMTTMAVAETVRHR